MVQEVVTHILLQEEVHESAMYCALMHTLGGV